MISGAVEYQKAKNELHHLDERLERLHREFPGAEKGLTKAGVRKLIARLHEELAVYEGSLNGLISRG